MKLFTISESVSEGIRVQLTEGEAYIPVGSTRFPTSRTIRDGLEELFTEAKYALAQQDLTSDERSYLEDLTKQNRIVLRVAGVSHERNKIQREDGWSTSALVLVDTVPGDIEPGVPGTIRYTSRAYREDQESPTGPVFRVYDTSWPAVGIEELASSESQKLLLLRPHSGFRMERNGDLQGAPPSLMVSWKGYGQPFLQVYYPRPQKGPR